MGQYKNALLINEEALDAEWLEQSMSYMGIAEELADAKLEYDNQKLKVERLRSKHFLLIKEDCTDYGVEKTTENSIKALIDGLKDVQSEEDELVEVRANMNRLSSAEKAWEMRKSSLTKLTDLKLAGYFSEPKARMSSAGTKHYKEERRDKVETTVSKSLNKPRRRRS